MKKIALIVTFLLISALGFNQSVEKTFYLKNGSIIKGVVIEEIPGKQYKVKTSDGNVFVFKAEEIEKITLESSLKKDTKKQNELDDKLTFYNLNELSLGVMVEKNSGGTYNFGLSTINGLSINNQLNLGIGIEYQYSGLGSFIPFYLDVRFNFLKTPNTFFSFLNAGFAISGRSENIKVVRNGFLYDKAIEYENGFLGRIGFGYRTNMSKKMNATISLFYTAHSYEAYSWLYDQVYFSAKGIYSVIGVKLGIGFNKKLK